MNRTYRKAIVRFSGDGRSFTLEYGDALLHAEKIGDYPILTPDKAVSELLKENGEYLGCRSTGSVTKCPNGSGITV